jgi:hypothetical protein
MTRGVVGTQAVWPSEPASHDTRSVMVCGVRARGLSLLAVGLALLSVAWVFATPPFQAPDEAAHYLRALTIAEGRLLGPRAGPDAAGRAALAGVGWRAREQRWILHDQRSVVVAAALAPPGQPCIDGRPDVGHMSCTEVTYTGDYYPIGYLLPAAAIAVSGDVASAQWLSRAASLLPALAFLVLALAVVGRRSGWSTIGLLAAMTPAVLFIGSVLNPSGLETAANLAFVAALLRLRRDREAFPGWAWVSLAVSGAVTILAWQLGPLFATVDLATFIALSGRAGLRSLLATRRRPAAGVALTLALAATLFAAYGLASGVLHSSAGFTPFFPSLRAGVDQLGPTLREAVGGFGKLTSNLPALLPLPWGLGVLAMLCAALIRGDRRERVVLALIFAAALGFPVLFYAWSQRPTGFGMQGRYALPLLALIPMAAGDVLDGGGVRASRLSNRLHAIAIAAIAIFQLTAWWINADHWAGTSAGGLVLSRASWTPPVGWWPWLVLAAIGTIALLTAAAVPMGARAASRPAVGTGG